MNSSHPFKATAAENPLCFHHSLRVQHSAFASRTHGFHERTNWANTAAQPHYDDYHCEKRHSKFFSNGFSDEWYARYGDNPPFGRSPTNERPGVGPQNSLEITRGPCIASQRAASAPSRWNSATDNLWLSQPPSLHPLPWSLLSL